MSQTTTRPLVPHQAPHRSPRHTELQSAHRTVIPFRSAPSGGIRRRLTLIVRRAFTAPEPTYRPRAVDTQPFEHGSIEWRRALLSMQQLT